MHVTVFQTADIALLALAKSLLDAADIVYVVNGEETLSLLPVSPLWSSLGKRLPGAVIEVPQDQVIDARRILENVKAGG